MFGDPRLGGGFDVRAILQAQAYIPAGFDLTPIYARRREWAETVAQHKRLKDARKRMFDEITICRRATEEALSALAQHFPEVDRSDLEHRLEVLKTRTPRRSGSSLPEGLAEAWKEARHLAEDAFYKAGCEAPNAGTLKHRTDLLVRLVTTALTCLTRVRSLERVLPRSHQRWLSRLAL